jgi:hypothetical protein
MKPTIGMAAITALWAFAATAQDTATEATVRQLKEQVNRMVMVGNEFALEGAIMSEVKGAPYSADQVSESTQTLADGTRIHNERTVTIYRDGQGRVRRETPESISIWDPVAGVNYNLNPKTMTYSKMQVSVSASSGKAGNVAFAVRTPLPPPPPGAPGDTVAFKKIITYSGSGEGAGASIVFSDGKRVTMAAPKHESLGQQTMEGVAADGTRETTTIDTGAIGNDRPIQIVSERWYSQELKTEIMTRHSDPRMGEQIMRLTNIRRGEPDPSLFQVPAGYQLAEPRKLMPFPPHPEQQ